jgi:isopropylmalate/homocitrate/citramalate synthase
LTTLLDSTLREGELFRVLKLSAKLELVEKLAEAGVKRVEITVDYPPRTTREDVEPLVRKCNTLGFEVVLHGRAVRDDLEAAAKYDATGVGLYIALTEIHRRHKLRGISFQEGLERLVDAVKTAREMGFRYVRATVEDASRFFVDGQLTPLIDAVNSVRRAGATLVSVPDTAGLLSPQKAREFITFLREKTDAPLAAHFHNDYGMASANTVEAVLAGADEAHVTVMGVGDRNGIADLYEVVAVLEDIHGIDLGVDRSKLNSLYGFFSKVAGLRLPWRHPLSEEARTIRAGVHQSMAVEKPEGYMPEKKLQHDVENPVFEIGVYSSHKLVAHLTGLPPTDPRARSATEALARKAREKNGRLSIGDIKEVLRDVLGLEVDNGKLRRFFGGEKVYILAKLNPRFDPEKIHETLVSWDDVETVDEVYGDVDLVVVGRMRLSSQNLVERFRDFFAEAIDDLKVLVAD